MKRFSILVVLLVMTVLFLSPSQSFAQGDTLVVYATPDFLNDVIMKDTTLGGVQAHKVYKLVSRDTTYIINAGITVKSDITVLGVLDPVTKRPPCIQAWKLQDGSVPGNVFTLIGKGKKAHFKNLYLLALATPDGVNGGGVAIQVSADSIAVTVDNVVFEEWQTFAIGYNGNWDKFLIMNCKFRNMVHPNQWYIGEVLRNEWPGEAYTDSVIFRNNTMLCINGYASATVTKYYTKYFEFVNNSVIYTFKNPFFEFNTTIGKFNNNIFYGPWSGGISKAEYPWWDQLWSPEVGSIIDMDTLNLVKDSLFNPADIGKPDFRMLSEAKRQVQVRNNAYWWPPALTSYWQAWNDTAHVDSVYTPTWMNARTMNMFTDKTTWPGFYQGGNLNVDPGFGASIPAVLTQSPDGLLDWFALCRRNQLSTTYWGYSKTVVGSAANWIPTWPLPESAHMQYSNTALKTGGTHGGPIGDPNWFGLTVGVDDKGTGLPEEYSLSQNYPNPFNPETMIRYSTVAAGHVTLKVYNVLGQVVATLVNEVQEPGAHDVTFAAKNLPTGVYFYKLEAGKFSAVRKMMLVK